MSNGVFGHWSGGGHSAGTHGSHRGMVPLSGDGIFGLGGGGGHGGHGGGHHGGRGGVGFRGGRGGGWGPRWYGGGYLDVIDTSNPCTTPWLYPNPEVACDIWQRSVGLKGLGAFDTSAVTDSFKQDGWKWLLGGAAAMLVVSKVL